jgi:hypothetical protein
MPPVEFEPTIQASARQQTYALDRAATGVGKLRNSQCFNQRFEHFVKHALRDWFM